MASSFITGCAASATTDAKKVEGSGGKSELTVFAAASLSEALLEIATNYEAENENVKIIFNFDSSGTLKTQIQEGAECDLFISAAQKQMNQLDVTKDEKANPEKLNFINAATRIDILENKVVLAVADDNPSGLSSFEEIIEKCDLIALGNDDVPVGQYSIEILEHIGIFKHLEAEQKITYGSNVKEVTTQVLKGSVDCGIIYKTDAFSANLTVVAEADESLCRRIIYPAAVTKDSKNISEAQTFLNYMQTEKSIEIFKKVGFEQVK